MPGTKIFCTLPGEAVYNTITATNNILATVIIKLIILLNFYLYASNDSKISLFFVSIFISEFSYGTTISTGFPS